jgi:hypothetical protein
MEGPERDRTELIRTEALEVLQDALEWTARPAAWLGIADIVRGMAAAIAAEDLDALAAFTADLELASPLRVIRMGDQGVEPIPRELNERVNHLVHSLKPADQPEQAEPPTGK